MRQQQRYLRVLPKQYKFPIQSKEDMMFSQGLDRDGLKTPPFFANHTSPVSEAIIYPL